MNRIWVSELASSLGKPSLRSYSMACQTKSKMNVHGISNCLLLKKQVLLSAVVSTVGTKPSALLLQPPVFQIFTKYSKEDYIACVY